MKKRIAELVKQLPDISFCAHPDGDIYGSEKHQNNPVGWWLYEAKRGHEFSSNLNMNVLSELITLLLKRELER